MVWTSGPQGRLAKALITLLDQVNVLAPTRSQSSDGTIGDAAHQATNSDHNAVKGVVTALDLTHDPAGGFDSYAFAESLRQNRDPRIKYVISNGRIWSSQVSPYVWRTYTGANPHDMHVHVSLLYDTGTFDDTTPFKFELPAFDPNAPRPRPLLKRGSTGPDVEVLQRLLGVTVDGRFGADTETAVRVFQAKAGLAVDGRCGQYTWRELLTPRILAAAEFPFSGKGSWYSQYRGKHEWVDTGDKPNSNALGVPDECQGISFLNVGAVGDWFEILAPNGVRSVEQRTDTGPAAWTGRLIDISAACAERIGYTPKNFPTDGVFKWRPIEAPKEVAGLSRQQQAITYYKLRKQIKEEPVPDPTPMPQIDPKQIAESMAKLAAIAETLAKVTADVAANKNPIDLSWLTKIFPGLATHGSLWSYVILCALQVFGTVGTATGSTATPTGSILTMLLAGLGGSGLLSIVGRLLKPTTTN